MSGRKETHPGGKAPDETDDHVQEEGDRASESGERLQEKVKKKLESAADDLRAIADRGHRHAGHLHEEALLAEDLARKSETVLNDTTAPVGKSGQGAQLPRDAGPSESPERRK